jgi:hypothetical protein
MLSGKTKNIQVEQLTGTDIAKLNLSLQLDQVAARKRTSNWILLFLILLALFLLLSYANIRATYNYLFQFWKDAPTKPPFCAVSPQGIMWAIAKPWVNQLFITNPLDRNTALFLNLVILEHKLDAINNGLVMMCGSPCSFVHGGGGGEPDEATCYDDLTTWTKSRPQSWQVPENPMWQYMGIPHDSPIVNEFVGTSSAKEALKIQKLAAAAPSPNDGEKKSSVIREQQQLTNTALLSQYVINPEPLLVLYKRGLATLAGLRNTYAPIDTFAYLWSDAPTTQCPTTGKTGFQQFTTVASSTALWSMVGAGFTAGAGTGPIGAVAGLFVGLGIGIAQVLLDPGTRSC